MTPPKSPQSRRSCLALAPLLILAPVLLALDLVWIVLVGLVLAGVAWAVSAMFDLPLKSALWCAFLVWGVAGVIWIAFSTWRGVRCPGCGRRIKTQKPLRCGACGGPAALNPERKIGNHGWHG